MPFALTDGVGRLALDADEPPLPKAPEPLPFHKPQLNQVGPGRRFATVAEYEAKLAEYNSSRMTPSEKRRRGSTVREGAGPAASATEAA